MMKNLLKNRIENDLSRRRRRRVRFALDDTDTQEQTSAPQTSVPPLFTTLKLETCVKLWYQPAEISGFKKDARNIVLFGTASDDDEHSGLERFNFERSMGKKSAIRYVLLAQKQQKGPEFIRLVYEKCTIWATDLALDQGFKDFCQAYDPL
jgi:hypothetical protein